MPKRSRSVSNYVGRGTMVVSNKRRKRGKFRSRQYKRNIRRTVFNSLEKHQSVLRLNDTLSTTAAFHTMVRCAGPDGEAAYSDSALILTRDGSRVQPLSLRVDAVLEKADEWNIARIIIFQCRTAYTGISQLLQTYPTAGDYDVWSTYNRVNMGNNIKILFDRRYFLDTYHPRKVIKWKCPKKYLKQIQYNGNGINDYTKNMIFMVFFSDSGAALHPRLFGLVNCKICQL